MGKVSSYENCLKKKITVKGGLIPTWVANLHVNPHQGRMYCRRERRKLKQNKKTLFDSVNVARTEVREKHENLSSHFPLQLGVILSVWKDCNMFKKFIGVFVFLIEFHTWQTH